jgi:alpha-L-fucosidase
MLNIGLKGDGTIPERAAESLRGAGEWIHRYPQVIYGTEASPWGHALPWGDVTVMDDRLFLAVFEWPASGRLHLPGLRNQIRSVKLLTGEGEQPISESRSGTWTCLELPPRAADPLVSVIEVQLDGAPQVDPCFGLDPEHLTVIEADFAEVEGVGLEPKKWMEKFGEWKHIEQITGWEKPGTARWEVDVMEPGNYQVDLNYSGEGRIVWGVSVEGGESIRNQQNSSHNYQTFPIGWLNFPETGRYRIEVTCLEGEKAKASLASIAFTRVP